MQDLFWETVHLSCHFEFIILATRRLLRYESQVYDVMVCNVDDTAAQLGQNTWSFQKWYLPLFLNYMEFFLGRAPCCHGSRVLTVSCRGICKMARRLYSTVRTMGAGTAAHTLQHNDFSWIRYRYGSR